MGHRLGTWLQGLKGVALLLVLASSSHAWGKFEFSGYTASRVTISESNTPIPYTFTVTYTPFEGDTWNGGNPFANYRIGLSDFGVYDATQLNYIELEKVMDWSSIKVKPSQGNPPQAPINSKGWTHGQGSGLHPGNGTATSITATFEVKLKPQGLRDLYNSGKKFEFYVHGEELSGTTFFENPYDKQLISIQINYPANVKVSGLKDLPVSNGNTAGAYYWNQADFCVYVSREPRNYRIGFVGKHGNDFRLNKTGSNDSINYTVQFAESLLGLDTATEHSSRFISTLSNGSDSLDCNNYTNNNGAVRVKVPKADADVLPDGVYTDTVTVMVQAT